jgi:hypothetical protein
VFAIKVETTHDTNGNPRRGWLVYERPGVCVDWVEEGYRGELPLRSVHGDVVVTVVLAIPPSEWRRIRKAARTREAWNAYGLRDA